MERRTFLKQSAIGIGTLAGVHSGILNARGESLGMPRGLLARYGGAMTGKMVLTDFIDSAIAEGKLIRDVSSLKMIPQSGSETGAGKAASPIMSVNVRMSRTMLP